jgi:hypothetical protein
MIAATKALRRNRLAEMVHVLFTVGTRPSEIHQATTDSVRPKMPDTQMRTRATPLSSGAGEGEVGKLGCRARRHDGQ